MARIPGGDDVRPFEVAFYILLVILMLLGWWVIRLESQLSFAESLICQDALMELVYSRRFP
jgi:hypothetical protein